MLDATLLVRIRILALLSLFMGLIPSGASGNQSVSEIYSTCLQCHQNSNNSEQSIGPNIAGQPAWYLAKQLNDFKLGIRGTHSEDQFGMQMAAISQTIADELIEPLAVYISSLPSQPIDQQTDGDLKNGYRYYHARCGACHGKEGQGDESFKTPNLRIIDTAYLLRQIANYKQDIRGTHAQDRLGRQMNMMAKVVSDEELHDILHFLQQ